MKFVVYLLIAILVILIIGIIVWIVYCRAAGHQKTLTLSVPFTETYRFIPEINEKKKYKLDSVEISITGTLISHDNKIKDIIKETIVTCYNNTLLLPEKYTMIVDSKLLGSLNRQPLAKSPTLENLTVMFFNRLEPLLPAGSQLISLKLRSEGIKLNYSRYKLNNYKLNNR